MSSYRLLSTLGALLVLTPFLLAAESTPPKKGKSPAHVSRGEEVDLGALTVKGKTTIFHFTSDYCGPCLAIAPQLQKLHAVREDIAVVKVDINRPNVQGIDGSSPVIKQFAIRTLPHFKIYGPDGKLSVEDTKEDPKARAVVNGWLKKM